MMEKLVPSIGRMEMKFHPHETYMKHRKMLLKLCWEFHALTGADMDDLISEANLVFVESLNLYRGDVGAFSTWLYRSVQFKFMTLMRQRGKKLKRERSLPQLVELADNSRFDENILLDIALSDLSLSSKIIINLIFSDDSPVTVRCDESGWAKRISKASIREYLKETGWSGKKISACFKEISDLVKNFA